MKKKYISEKSVFAEQCSGTACRKTLHCHMVLEMEDLLISQFCSSIHLHLFLALLADALYQVSEKLEGPFNMELAADSISVKVSEAIMHMQENSVSISTKARERVYFSPSPDLTVI